MAKDKLPFHVVKTHAEGRHTGYEIYLMNKPFLVQAYVRGIRVTTSDKIRDFVLKRHEAYAIARLLNRQRPDLKWADKFDDPYE